MRPVFGTFPIARVSNGHTFFVQKLHDIVGVAPVAVHTTYQYGDSTECVIEIIVTSAVRS